MDYTIQYSLEYIEEIQEREKRKERKIIIKEE